MRPAILARLTGNVVRADTMASALIFAKIIPDEGADLQDCAEGPDGTGGEAASATPGVFDKLKETALFIGSTLGILREDQAFRWFALSVFAYGFGNLLTVPIIPLIQVDELHIRKSQLAILANLTQVAAVVAFLLGPLRGPPRPAARGGAQHPP